MDRCNIKSIHLHRKERTEQIHTGGSFQELGGTHGAEDLVVAGIIANFEARQFRGVTVEGMDGGVVTLVRVRARVQLKGGQRNQKRIGKNIHIKQ